MDTFILQLLSIFMQTSICYYFVITLSSVITIKTYSKKNLILGFLGFLIVITIGVFLKSLSPSINIILIGILMFIIFKFIFKLSIIKSILLCIFLFIFLGITELIIVYIGMFIFNNTAAIILQSTTKSMFLIFLQAILCFFITTTFKYIIEKITKIKDFSENINSKQLILLIILLVLCLLPQLIFFVFKVYAYSVSLLFINSIELVFVSFIIVVYFKTIVERDKSQSDLFTSELHNKTMVGMVDGVRTLKHDYNNIMQSLNGYVSTKQYDKLQEHINKVLEECNIVNNLSIISPEIFNHPAIYGIVGAKYFLAIEANITFDLDIITNINEISFFLPDLSRILGILLDNAIEATSKTDNQYIRLEMKYDNRKGSDIIRVINTYDTDIQINLKDIYKKGVSSKEIKSGLGLWEVKKIVNKARNSQVFATIEGNKFVQNLIIEKN